MKQINLKVVLFARYLLALIILQNRKMKGELIFHSTGKYIWFLYYYCIQSSYYNNNNIITVNQSSPTLINLKKLGKYNEINTFFECIMRSIGIYQFYKFKVYNIIVEYIILLLILNVYSLFYS